MNKERDWNIDYLRILACFMVVFLHVSGQNWRTTDITSLEWQIFHFYDALVRSAVPLFLMISGKLFLQKETMTPLSRFYKKMWQK